MRSTGRSGPFARSLRVVGHPAHLCTSRPRTIGAKRPGHLGGRPPCPDWARVPFLLHAGGVFLSFFLGLAGDRRQLHHSSSRRDAFLPSSLLALSPRFASAISSAHLAIPNSTPFLFITSVGRRFAIWFDWPQSIAFASDGAPSTRCMWPAPLLSNLTTIITSFFIIPSYLAKSRRAPKTANVMDDDKNRAIESQKRDAAIHIEAASIDNNDSGFTAMSCSRNDGH